MTPFIETTTTSPPWPAVLELLRGQMTTAAYQVFGRKFLAISDGSKNEHDSKCRQFCAKS